MTLFENCLHLFPSQSQKEKPNQKLSDSNHSSENRIKNTFHRQTTIEPQTSLQKEADNLVITNLYDAFLECHLNLALCLIRLAHFEEATSCLNAVIEYAPLNIQAYYLRGKAFLCINEYPLALDDLKITSRLVKENPEY